MIPCEQRCRESRRDRLPCLAQIVGGGTRSMVGQGASPCPGHRTATHVGAQVASQHCLILRVGSSILSLGTCGLLRAGAST